MQAKSRGDRIFEGVVFAILLIFCISIIYPFWNLVVISFNTSADTARGGLTIFPREFTLENYDKVFQDSRLLRAFYISSLRTVITTVCATMFTSMFAYGMSKKELRGRKIYMKYCAITMYVSGGLIPGYLLMQNLNLINSFWVFVVPSMFSVWNMIIFRSFFENVSEGLIEAAKIDGAGEYRIFFGIVMPVSKPVFATLALFTAVGQWNAWFDGAIYISDPELMPLPTLLRQIINTNAASQLLAQMPSAAAEEMAENMISTRSLSAATMMLSIVPIVAVYPFVQKHFTSGIMLGSIKE